MKKYSTLLGAAVVGLSATASFATISLQVTTVAINTTLSTNGWVGYELQLVATGTSTGVASLDFANNFNNGIVSISGNIGIHGDIHQQWIIPVSGSSANSTATPNMTAPQANQNLTRDSFWFTGAGTGNPAGYLSNPDAPAEDNDKANGPNPPFTESPIADKAADSSNTGFDYGVGTFMTMSGAFNTPLTTTVNLAIIIVPATVQTVIRGTVEDQSTAAFIVNTTLPAASIPEPASVGLLALGAGGLLARRRRRA